MINVIYDLTILGMLLVGALLRNVPVIDVVGNHLDPNWSGALRYVSKFHLNLDFSSDKNSV